MQSQLASVLASMVAQDRGRARSSPRPLVKMSEVQPFKGDPEDLERFLVQLTNMFNLDEAFFANDMHCIQYASNLLHRTASSRFQDPSKWYETYHLLIDERAASRLPGYVPGQMDPVWRTWERFEATLRQSFSSRVGRHQAIQQWQALNHTGGIDDFLDEINRLMWRTGYTGDVVKDKVARSLKPELGRQWYRVFPKPDSITAQIAMLREMGHRKEEYEKIQDSGKPQQNSEKPQGSLKDRKVSKQPRQPEENKAGAKGKRKRDESKEWKDKDVELAGIPDEIRKERRKAGNCQKCGKGTHMWYECYTKEPVKTSVAGLKRPRKEESKKKISGVKASPIRRVEELPDSDMEILDYEVDEV